ncbi:peptidoglycan-binding protein [Kitasatospora sp. NPDC057015]|uniref:peptidoglycan-binding domain-containing protein n=1 Tax=Kitasatospora sp. NPDC057015 TaxID=3346001 RepID=UPI003633A8DD
MARVQSGPVGSPVRNPEQRPRDARPGAGTAGRGGSLAAAVGPVALIALHGSARVPPAGHLRHGSTGCAVERLQSALNGWLDTPIAVDGRFGPATLAGVVGFQRGHGLEPDGVVGPRTAGGLLWIPLRLPSAEGRSCTGDDVAPIG